MAHGRASTQARSGTGELSGTGRVGRRLEEFGAKCRELAGAKKAAGRQQGKRHRYPELHRAEPVEGCLAPPQPAPRLIHTASAARIDWGSMLLYLFESTRQETAVVRHLRLSPEIPYI